MKPETIIREVIKTYDAIGEEFDATRRTTWPEFDAFKRLIKPGMRVLDAGCGNGRIAHFLKDIPLSYFGYDGSKKLIAKAKNWWHQAAGPTNKHKAHFSVGNILTKKYTKKFDAIISSAVLHHLPTPLLQRKHLVNLKSQLNAGRFLYISVWNLWQPKYTKLIHKQTKAAMIPWGKSGKKRFYYAFTPAELHKLLANAGFTKIEHISSTHNFCFIAWKK